MTDGVCTMLAALTDDLLTSEHMCRHVRRARLPRRALPGRAGRAGPAAPAREPATGSVRADRPLGRAASPDADDLREAEAAAREERHEHDE